MDVFEFAKSSGYVDIKNPNYNPKAKKNKQPKFITVQDLSGEKNTPLVEGMRQTVNDRWSIDAETNDKYAAYGIPYNRLRNLDSELAEAQSNWSKVGNSLAQTLVSEIGAGTIRGFSDIFGGLYDLVTGNVFKNDYNYTNRVSDAIDEFQRNFEEKTAPIYVDPDVDIYNGGLTNIGWIAKNLPSVASTLTLLIPARAISASLGKIASTIGKGIKTSRAARTAGKVVAGAEDAAMASRAKALDATFNTDTKLDWFRRQIYTPEYAAKWKAGTKIGTEAALMRTMENYQESSQIYKDVYGDTLDKLSNMSDTEFSKFIEDNREWLDENNIDSSNKVAIAKAVAGNAADRTFTIDFSNIVFDVIQLYSLRNIGRIGRTTRTPELERMHRASMANINKTSEEIVASGAKRSTRQKLWDKTKDVVRGSGRLALAESTEGIEEAVNYIAQREGMHVANTLLDRESELTKFSFWNDRLDDYIKSPELMESAFWGLIGGVVFGAGGNALNKYKAKKRQQAKEKKEGKDNVSKGSPEAGEDFLNSYISSWDEEDVKAAKESIQKRDLRYQSLSNKLNILFKEKQNPFAPLENGKYQELQSDVERDILAKKIIDNYVSEVALDAKNNGTFGMLKEYFRNDNVKNAFKEITGDITNDIDAFTEDIIRKLDAVSELYDNEVAHMNMQAAAINARHVFDDALPLTYVQQIAYRNVQHKLEIDNINKIEKSLKLELNKLQGEIDVSQENGKFTKEDLLRYDKISKLSYFTEQYARLEADKKRLKSGKEVDSKGEPLLNWVVNSSINSINKKQKELLSVIRNMYGESEGADAYAAMLHTLRRASKYEKGQDNQYYINEAIEITDENIIKAYEDSFKDNNISLESIQQISAKIQEDIKDFDDPKGLYDTNYELWETYNLLAETEFKRFVANSKIVRSQKDLLEKADYMHNTNNELRKSIIDDAVDNVQRIYVKYKDTKGSEIRQMMDEAYKRNYARVKQLAREHLTEKDDEGKLDSEKFIDALTIINFSYAANENAYDQIKLSLDIADDMIARNDVIKEEQKKASERVKTEGANNTSSKGKQAVSDSENAQQSNLNGGQTQQPTQNSPQSPAETGFKPSLQGDENGICDYVTLKMDEEGKITDIRHKNGGLEVTVGPDPLSNEKYLNISGLDEEAAASWMKEPYIFEQLENTINPKTTLQIVRNPILAPVDADNLAKGWKLVERGTLKAVENETGETVEGDDSSDEGEPIQPSSTGGEEQGESEQQSISEDDKELGVLNAAKQFVDYNAESFEKQQIIDNTINAVRENNTLNLTDDEINNFAEKAASTLEGSYNFRQRFKSRLQQEAADATFAARTEERQGDIFSDFFRRAITNFVDEYSKNTLMPEVDGKKVVKLYDLIKLCKETNSVIDSELRDKVFTILKEYFNSEEGRSKYLLIDEAELTVTNILDEINKSQEEILKRKLDSQKEYRVNINNAWPIEEDSEANKKRFYTAFNNIKKGDKLRVEDAGGLYYLYKDGVIVGELPLPYTTDEGKYYAYNDGLRTEVWVGSDGKVHCSIETLLTSIFTEDYPEYAEIRGLFAKARAAGGYFRPGQTLPDDIYDAFSSNVLISTLYSDSVASALDSFAATKRGEPTPFINDIYVSDIDARTSESEREDLERVFNGLYKLYYFVDTTAITDKEEVKQTISDNLSRWFYNLYNTYNTLGTINLDESGTVTVEHVSEGECIKIVDGNTKNNHIKLKYASEAFADKSKARLTIKSVRNPNEVISSNPKVIDSRFDTVRSIGFDRSSRGSSFISLYGNKDYPDFVEINGCRLANSEDINRNNKLLGNMQIAVKARLANMLVDYIRSYNTDVSRAKKDAVIDCIKSIFRTTNDTDRIPLFSLIDGGSVTIQDKLDMRGFEGFSIRIQQGSNMRKIDIITKGPKGVTIGYQVQDKVDNDYYYKTRPGEQKHIIFGNRNISLEQQISGIVQDIFHNKNYGIQGMFQINVDQNGIELDNSSRTIKSGFIRREIVEGEDKVVLKIPAIGTRGNVINVSLSADSYNDLIIDNDLIKVNTQVGENGTNYNRFGKSARDNARLSVSIGTTSPVEESTTATTPQTRKEILNKYNLTEFDVATLREQTNVKLYTTLKDILSSNSKEKGEAIIAEMFGKDYLAKLKSIAKETGIDLENGDRLFPNDVTYEDKLNANGTDANGNRVWLGNVAEANASDDVYTHVYEDVNGTRKRKTRRVKKGEVIVGPRFLNLAASSSSNLKYQAIRKLIHEQIHLELGNGKYNKEDVYNAVDPIASKFWNEVLRIKNDTREESKLTDDEKRFRIAANSAYNALSSYANNEKRDRFLEEFITEGITNRDVVWLMNNIKVGEQKQVEKKSLLSKFIDFISKIFNWHINSDSMYMEFVNTIANIPTVSVSNNIVDQINSKESISSDDIEQVAAAPIDVPTNATNELRAVIDEINTYKSWQAEHVTFDEENHDYYVDGVKMDCSITQFYDKYHPVGDGPAENYTFSSVLGNGVDAMTRDYFLGLDVRKIHYPNFTGEEKEKVIKSLDRLKKYLDKEFDGCYKVITNEIRLVGKLKKFGQFTTVAGTMDMLIIDKHGVPHVFDMKTKRYGASSVDELNEHDRAKYTEQLNLYRQLLEMLFPSAKGKINDLRLIWFDQTYPSPSKGVLEYKVDETTKEITVSRRNKEDVSLSEYKDGDTKMWNSPKLNKDVETSLIKLNTDNVDIDSVTAYDSKEQTQSSQELKPSRGSVPPRGVRGSRTRGEINRGVTDKSISEEDMFFDGNMSVDSEGYAEFNVMSLESVEAGIPFEFRNAFVNLVNNGELNYKCR